MDGYVEIETPVSPDESNYIYVRPLGASQYFVGAHFGDDFDAWWELFHNASMRSSMKQKSPILYWLLFHGLETDFKYCALVKLPDTDDQQDKWWVASVVDNVDARTADEVLSPRSRKVIVKVAERVALLNAEMQKTRASPNLAAEVANRALPGVLGLLIKWWQQK